jgi:hypothetical protein
MTETHIVLTTISIPRVLPSLYKNIMHYGRINSVKVWVVGDLKTPPETKTFCDNLSQVSIETEYLDVCRQDKWGIDYPRFYSRIPYNNETRRNIGYLHAFADKECKRAISIDDDNFPTKHDFIGGHSITGSPSTPYLLKETTGFYNICEHLAFEPKRHIYPRGYPFSLRNTLNRSMFVPSGNVTTVGVNAGLWINDPDIDAITWLNGKVTGREPGIRDNTTCLSQNTWTPINTQNTSVARELIPAFFCIPMGANVPGGNIQRYGDILGGYFLQAVMQNTKYCISFGKPFVDHRRNPHDYVSDLRAEYWGMLLTDWIVDRLKNKFEVNPEDDIFLRMIKLADFIDIDRCYLPQHFPTEIAKFLHDTSDNIRYWINVCRVISNETE